MNQQTATISFAIIFFIIFGLYLRFSTTEISTPTITTDISSDDVSNDKEPATSSTDDISETISINNDAEVTPEEPTATDSSPPVFNLFDEEAFEKESDNIQTGIDLLNNPLR